MTVKEAIEILSKCNPESELVIEDGGGSMGSSQTGWMAEDCGVEEINDLETRVVIVRDYM